MTTIFFLLYIKKLPLVALPNLGQLVNIQNENYFCVAYHQTDMSSAGEQLIRDSDIATENIQ
jgi:hypothetical protein